MSPSAPTLPDRPRPGSCRELFLAFSLLAMQGFGGVMAVIQRELVERRGWLTREGFVEDWSVAQVLPGPNVVNLALMFGDRHFGWRGAAAAMLGLLVFPLLLLMVLVLGFAHYQHLPQVQGALRGMGAVAAGLIVATALKLSTALHRHVLGRPAAALIAALVFVAIAVLRLPLPWVLLGLGGPACLLVAWRLARLEAVRPGAGGRP
ncbi:chromate transporter [Sphaerotilus hippei]|uniref:Chromate transporter n=1 Tax=Sphaerotilus hippei TaxID=744406 RepID=A0A318H5W8_9BURK|nr:chromate transporter [Sphaerotilus hippei]PXW99305.1 chromate transporter [Sphaerotilus hippei]